MRLNDLDCTQNYLVNETCNTEATCWSCKKSKLKEEKGLVCVPGAFPYVARFAVSNSRLRLTSFCQVAQYCKLYESINEDNS